MDARRGGAHGPHDHMDDKRVGDPEATPPQRPLNDRRYTTESWSSSDAHDDVSAQPDVIYSPSEEGQYFAQQSPGLFLGKESSDVDDDTASSQAVRTTIRRYMLDSDDLCAALKAVDVTALRSLLPKAPLLNAIYISGADFHRIAHHEGSASPHLPPKFINLLLNCSRRSDDGVFEIPDLQQFLRQHNLDPYTVPNDLRYYVGCTISLPPSDGTKELGVALVALFDSSAEHAQTNRLLARSVFKMTYSCLQNRHEQQRRQRELKAQQHIVELNRLSHALTEHWNDPHRHPPSLASTEGRRFFLQVARAARNVLDAKSAVLLDVSGFKFGDVVPTPTEWHNDAPLHPRTIESEEQTIVRAAKQSSHHRRHSIATQGSSLDLHWSSDEARTDSGSSTGGSPQLGDSPPPPSRRKRSTVKCQYTQSRKPVPLLVASGAHKHHFENLSGAEIRPAIAKYLASVKAGRASPAEADEDGNLTCSCSKVHLGTSSPLSFLIPDDQKELVSLPILDPFLQPGYLLLITFADVMPALEPADLLFVEQLGTAVMGADLRMKGRAIHRAQVRLTSRMQHVLRTPLHSIIGSCEAAYTDDSKVSSETKSIISSVALSAESLDASISDLFDYAAMAGMREPTLGRPEAWPQTDFRSLFEVVTRSSIATWRLHCLSIASLDEDRHQVPPPPELIVTCSPGGWDAIPSDSFRFDVESLGRIVAKACANALQATKDGIVDVNLGVREVKNDGKDGAVTQNSGHPIQELVLRVSDTGHGMSKNFIDHHLFRTLDEALEDSAQHRMSLAICSAILSRLGGRITVTSTEGQGSSFEFIFPFSGPAASFVPPTGVKIAALPTEEKEKSGNAFLAFCDHVCRQYGAQFIGDAERHPELLDDAQVVLVAGERCEKEQDRQTTSSLLASRTSRNKEQVVIELPNRAYVDPPGSLKPTRKQVWLGEIPAVEVYRPFVPADVTSMRELLADVAAHRPVFNDEMLASAPSSGEAGAQAQSPTPDANTSSSSIKSRRQSSPDSFLTMIVEDEPINARILAKLLRRNRLAYIEARNGQEAVEMYGKHFPQVILLDINMPIMNGFEAAVEIRKIRGPHHPRIIAVSALSLETDKIRGKSCGIDEWLVKPVRLAQLAHDIKAWKEEASWNDTTQDPPEVDPPSAEELARHTINEAGEHPTNLLP